MRGALGCGLLLDYCRLVAGSRILPNDSRVRGFACSSQKMSVGSLAC